MPDQDFRSLVVDGAVAREAGLGGRVGIHVVSVPARRQRRVEAGDVIDVLDAAGDDALVLARPPWREPALAPIPAISLVLGREILWLPAELPAAAWAAALIASWARSTPAPDLSRRAQVAAGLALMPPSRLPLRRWGADGIRVPAMASESLARWCDCAWQACDWCDAGGIDEAPCPACGHRAAA